MTETDGTGKTYSKVKEPDGDTSIAIVNESMRLGPGASNPDIADAVEENHDIDTSPSWVSRVRNDHLEVVEDAADIKREGPEPTGTENDEQSSEEPGVKPEDKRPMSAAPEEAVDRKGPTDPEEVSLPVVVEEVVDQYTAEVEQDVTNLESDVAELRRSIERLIDVLEDDTYPTDLSEYPDDVQTELRSDALRAELDELCGKSA